MEVSKMVSDAQATTMLSLFKFFNVNDFNIGNLQYVNSNTGVSAYVMRTDSNGKDTTTMASFDSTDVSGWIITYGIGWIQTHDPAEYAILTGSTTVPITTTTTSGIATMVPTNYMYYIGIALIALIMIYIIYKWWS